MKKLLIILSLTVTTAFSYATKPVELNQAFLSSGKLFLNSDFSGENKTGNAFRASNAGGCTVTITASVGYSATYVSASCSSTKSTCEAAISEASGCVKTALAAAKKNIK